jgi:hypothetical protein
VTLVHYSTAAYKRDMMDAAHDLDGPACDHAILMTRELVAALPTD